MNAFDKCSNLASVTFPNNLTGIGNWAFSSCPSLTSITIPSKVTSIGGQTFINSGLTRVTFLGSIPSNGFPQSASNPFPGDLRDKFYATDKDNGTPGTYTRPNGNSTTWTKQ